MALRCVVDQLIEASARLCHIYCCHDVTPFKITYVKAYLLSILAALIPITLKAHPGKVGTGFRMRCSIKQGRMFRGGALSSQGPTRCRPSDLCNKAMLPHMTVRISQVLRLKFWIYLRREKWLNPRNINQFRGYGHVIVGLHVHPVSWGRVESAAKA